MTNKNVLTPLCFRVYKQMDVCLIVKKTKTHNNINFKEEIVDSNLLQLISIYVVIEERFILIRKY